MLLQQDGRQRQKNPRKSVGQLDLHIHSVTKETDTSHKKMESKDRYSGLSLSSDLHAHAMGPVKTNVHIHKEICSGKGIRT